MTTTVDDHDIRVALTDASLDAPRVDLWGRLQAPTRQLTRARRPLFVGLRALAAALAIVLVSAGALAIAARTRPERPASSNAVTVPDTLLVSAWDQNSESQGLKAFLPGTNQMVDVLEGVGGYDAPLIAPDGKQLIYTRTQNADGMATASLVAIDAATLAPQWSIDLASQALNDASCCGFVTTAAIAGDRVYTVTKTWYAPDSQDPVVVVAYSRADGKVQGRWTLDLGAPYVGGVRLFGSRDGSQLYVVADVAAQAPAQNSMNPQFLLAYQRFDLPNMTLAQRVDPGTGSTAAAQYYERLTPDGKALYAIGFANNARGLAVSFFDLASGTPQMPIEVGDEADGGFLYQHAVSPDGKTLYVFNPGNGALSIFDLTARQFTQSIEVDMSRAEGHGRSIFGRAWDAVRGVFVQDAVAKVYFQGTMQFSPDGSRLYAISVKGNGIDGTPDGVLVIDTRTWQVLAKWATDSAPVQLQQSADGRTLYVYSPSWYDNSQTTGMLLIDTSTGATTAKLDLATGNGGASIYTLADLYHDEWGQAPRIAGAGGARSQGGSFARPKPFPRLEVSVDRAAIISGDTVTITARFVDPQSGAPLDPDNDAVDYRVPDSIRAVLSRGSDRTDDVTVVLTGAGYGVYHGAAQLTTPGAWDVRVKTERAGEPNRSASLLGAVAVQPAFQGTDGRRYLLQIAADPAQPAAEQDFTFSVAFVDAETGAALPDNVDLQSGLPDKMDASFFGSGGVTSAHLQPTAHGVYAGTARVFNAGSWNASVNFRNDGVSSSAIDVGVVVAK